MRKLIIATLMMVAAGSAVAGTACTDFEPDANAVRSALTLAFRTRDALEASGARVALVARVGQDLSRYKLRYSHVGIAWRDHPQGRWLVSHELNRCATAESGIYAEGLGNFFLDDMFAYETLLVIPGDRTQQRLEELLAGDVPLRLHGLPYNMLAYAFSTRYQNSNQWALEVLAAASASDLRIESREQAQAWLKMAGYKPLIPFLIQ